MHATKSNSDARFLKTAKAINAEKFQQFLTLLKMNVFTSIDKITEFFARNELSIEIFFQGHDTHLFFSFLFIYKTLTWM